MDTTNDDLLSRHFSNEVPAELTGPTIERDAMRAGMIVRYLRNEKRGKDNQLVHVYQIPNAAGSVFTLWGTAQLNNKMRQLKRGQIVLLTYLGQSEDEDRVHQWRVQPFNGTPKELSNVVKQHPWPNMLETLEKFIAQAESAERARRAARGDGVPPHDDADSPFGGPIR